MTQPDQRMTTLYWLALFLGGSHDSFTGILLELIVKADPGNRAKIRSAFPREVMVWETWMSMDPAPTAAELAAALEADERK